MYDEGDGDKSDNDNDMLTLAPCLSSLVILEKGHRQWQSSCLTQWLKHYPYVDNNTHNLH